jgi:signal transduction histidine kinase
LAAGLSALADGSPIPVDVQVDGDLPGSSPVASAAWLLAADALANALKHAGASRVEIDLWVRPDDVELVVVDDGCGGVTGPAASLVHRAATVNGVVTVQAPQGVGTRVSAVLPRRVDPEVGS